MNFAVEKFVCSRASLVASTERKFRRYLGFGAKIPSLSPACTPDMLAKSRRNRHGKNCAERYCLQGGLSRKIS